MAIVKYIDAQASEIEKGQAYAGAGYPVDDSITGGLELAQLFAGKPDGTSKVFDNTNNAGSTAILADNTDETKLPVGIVYKSTAKDEYEGRNIESSRKLYPVGVKRETGSLQPLKEQLVREKDDTAPKSATRKTKAVTLTDVWSVDTGVSDTTITADTAGSATSELVAGDWVIINGLVKQVASVTDDDNIEVTKAFASDITSKALVLDADLQKPVYLGTGGDYQMLKPQSGVVCLVGRVVGANSVMIKLDDVNKFDELN